MSSQNFQWKISQTNSWRVCSHVSRWVANHLKGKQRDWSAAKQKRIAMTISMLASAKSIKMLGNSEAIQSKVQGLRVYEIDMSKRLRWIMVGYNASGKWTFQQLPDLLTQRSECPRHFYSSYHFGPICHHRQEPRRWKS